MRWILAGAAALTSACSLLPSEWRSLEGRDLVILGLVVGVLSLAAAWGLIAKRAPQERRPVVRRPSRITLDNEDVRSVRLRSPDGRIESVPIQSVEFALKDGYSRIPVVDMRTPDGTHVLVDADQVDRARAQGYWPMTPSEVAATKER